MLKLLCDATPDEIAARNAVIRDLYLDGLGLGAISELAGITYQRVQQLVKRMGITRPPVPMSHGRSRYKKGCRCEVCRRANADAMMRHFHRSGRSKGYYRRAYGGYGPNNLPERGELPGRLGL